jgi:hypothetical protein
VYFTEIEKKLRVNSPAFGGRVREQYSEGGGSRPPSSAGSGCSRAHSLAASMLRMRLLGTERMNH